MWSHSKSKTLLGRQTFSLLKLAVHGAVRGGRSNREIKQRVEDYMLLRSKSVLLMIQEFNQG